MIIIPIKLSAVTSHSRYSLVAGLTAALNELGSILDSHQFSNLALAIHFEISPRSVPKLRPALLALPMSLSNASLEALDVIEKAQSSELPVEITGSLNITFVHNEPDFHMHIPSVPG
jgi:hypothetical protein